MLAVQPLPPATGDLWSEFIADARDVLAPEILADMEARRVKGNDRRRTSLHTGSGCAFGAVAYLRLLDATIYAWGKAREQVPDTVEAVTWCDLAYEAADLAERVRVACGRVTGGGEA